MAAEDLVHNAFIKLICDIDENPDKVEMDTAEHWVGRGVQNSFLDMLSEERRKGISHSVNIDDMQLILATEFNQLSPVGHDLRKRIRRKKRPLQDWLIFHYEHGMPLRDIKAITCDSYHAIHKGIHRFKLELTEVYKCV